MAIKTAFFLPRYRCSFHTAIVPRICSFPAGDFDLAAHPPESGVGPWIPSLSCVGPRSTRNSCLGLCHPFWLPGSSDPNWNPPPKMWAGRGRRGRSKGRNGSFCCSPCCSFCQCYCCCFEVVEEGSSTKIFVSSSSYFTAGSFSAGHFLYLVDIFPRFHSTVLNSLSLSLYLVLVPFCFLLSHFWSAKHKKTDHSSWLKADHLPNLFFVQIELFFFFQGFLHFFSVWCVTFCTEYYCCYSIAEITNTQRTHHSLSASFPWRTETETDLVAVSLARSLSFFLACFSLLLTMG